MKGIIKSTYGNLLLYALLLALALTVITKPTNVYAQYTRLKAGGTAKVLEVIDGDSIKVQMTENNYIALVKLIGIDAGGGDEAFTFMNNELAGAQVALVQDTSITAHDSRWNLMYLYYGNRFINNELLEKGYAKLNPAHINAGLYSTLQAGEAYASSRNIGIWASGDIYNNYYYNAVGSLYYYSGNGLNINTASASTLREMLVDVNSSVVNNIISYRNYNPFATVEDIKFVSGFTKDMYDKNRSQMTICTNINRATEKELATLGSLTQYEIERIIDYRTKNNITSISTLYTENIISNSSYERIKPFIDIKDKTRINFAIPDRVANINTASHAQLVSAGLSSSQANAVIDARSRYSYKSIGELLHVPGASLSAADINRLADNLTTMTDINLATLEELNSLFGNNGSTIYNNRPFSSVDGVKSYISNSEYASIQAFIYIGNYTTNFININTASPNYLRGIGLSDSQADALYSYRGRMYSGTDIPIDIRNFDSKVVLYTNINTAGIDELLSLSPEMTQSIASGIISYRSDQPFGDLEEFGAHLESKGAYNLYNAIRNYVLVR